MQRRTVVRLQVLTLVATLVLAVVINIAVRGGSHSSSSSASGPLTGRQIYQANCATCHGVNGQGAVGPQLAGKVVAAFPNVEDQIQLVTDGKGGMPAWGGDLTPAQIRSVVNYTRTKLGT